MNPKWIIIALAVITTGALALRLPALSNRPMHNDEAVNGYKFGQLWKSGVYKYDPNEHHGPSLYYGTYAVCSLTGAPSQVENISEARLRLLTALAGACLVFGVWWLMDGLGIKSALWAAAFTALSPAMVFYSRYYIHETLLVLGALIALASGWRYWRSRRLLWAILAGAGLGLMDATKETFIISIVAAVLALAANQLWNRLLDASQPPFRAKPLNWSHLLAGLAAWLLVAVVLFSSFFHNLSGPLDSIRTYGPWLNRAGGDSPHIYPWYFYLQRLAWFHPAKGPVWSELMIILLAVVGAVAGFRRRKLGGANASFIRFLALYTFAVTAGYSLISYKTPWCLLNFLQGMALLAGVGAMVLLRSVRPGLARKTVQLFLLLGCAHLGWQAYAASFPYNSDQRNPYVFAHTSADVLRLVQKVQDIAKVSPAKTQTLIKVMAQDDDFWPLPWYLRGFQNVGYWDKLQQDPYAPMMIVSAQFHAGLDEKGTHLMVGYFELRPNVFLELYVEKNLWTAYLPTMPRQTDPDSE